MCGVSGICGHHMAHVFTNLLHIVGCRGRVGDDGIARANVAAIAQSRVIILRHASLCSGVFYLHSTLS